MDVLGKRIENPTLNYQFEGTKLIWVYPGGTYGSTIEVLAYGRIEVPAHGARMTYGRLLMSEQGGRREYWTASRVASIGQRRE